MAASVQQRFQTSLSEMKNLQRDLQKKVEMRQTLDAQLNENKIVKEELDLVKQDTKVFKLIGPVLVKQDLTEAKQTVSKRIDYISTELKRYDGMIKDIETKHDQVQENLAKLKQEFEQTAAKGQKVA